MTDPWWLWHDLSHLAQLWWHVVIGWLPWLGPASAGVGVGVGVAVRGARRRAVAEATWLEITAPARMPAEGSEALPRSLIGALASLRGLSPRLACELVGEGDRARVGVWVPGGGPVTLVAAAIRGALPGAGVQPTEPPLLSGQRVWGRELRPRRGPWTPLLSTTSPGRSVLQPGADTSDEGLRAVLNTVTEPGRRAFLQLVIAPRARQLDEPGPGVPTDPRYWGPWALRGALRAILIVLTGALELVYNMLTGSPHRSSDTPRGPRAPADAGEAAQAREWARKRHERPLVRVTLRVGVINQPRSLGRAVAAEVAAGYALALPRAQLRAVPAWRRGRALAGRRRGRGFMATLPELGALWHLPSQPHSYGLPAPSGGVRAPSWSLPRIPNAPYAEPPRDPATSRRPAHDRDRQR